MPLPVARSGYVLFATCKLFTPPRELIAAVSAAVYRFPSAQGIALIQLSRRHTCSTCGDGIYPVSTSPGVNAPLWPGRFAQLMYGAGTAARGFPRDYCDGAEAK